MDIILNVVAKILDYFKENIISIITPLIALVALFQTNTQIKISNKHFLFERRLNCYNIFKGMYNLYKENRQLLDFSENKDKPIEVDFPFVMLINNSYLNNIGSILEDYTNEKYKNTLLLKLEELNSKAEEVPFIFKNKHKNLLKDFIFYYYKVLDELYKYHIVSKLMESYNEKNTGKSYIEVQKIFNEPSRREELISSIEKLENSFNLISKKVLKDVEKEISL